MRTEGCAGHRRSIFMGRYMVFAYALAAVLCWRAATRHRSSPGFEEGQVPQLVKPGVLTSATGLWIGLTGLFVVLAISKQLDLQSWLVSIGRAVARSEDWYERRRIVQAIFIIAVAAGGLAVLPALAWLTRRTWRTTGLAVVGATFLITFILIRAASLHHIDQLLARKVVGVRLSWALELGAIACVAIGAFNVQRAESGRGRR
jgi:hypothetical protein